jgi:hypothetical protein
MLNLKQNLIQTKYQSGQELLDFVGDLWIFTIKLAESCWINFVCLTAMILGFKAIANGNLP